MNRLTDRNQRVVLQSVETILAEPYQGPIVHSLDRSRGDTSYPLRQRNRCRKILKHVGAATCKRQELPIVGRDRGDFGPTRVGVDVVGPLERTWKAYLRSTHDAGIIRCIRDNQASLVRTHGPKHRHRDRIRCRQTQ